MRKQLQQRLEELHKELQTGQATLDDLEAKANHVRTMMFRLSGAIQVLEEELEKAGPEDSGGARATLDDGPLAASVVQLSVSE